MSFVPNPLMAVNQAALQAAQQSDQQLQQGMQQKQGGGDQFSNSQVSKDLNTLIQKAGQQQQTGGAAAPGGFQPPSQDYLKVLSLAHNYHAAKQALAQSKLSEMGRQAQTGWMPDPKQMIKLVKQSGMKVDTSPEGIKTAVSYFKQYYGENDPVSGESREMPKEVQTMMEKARSGTMSKRDVSQFVMGGMVKNEMRSARYAELNDMQRAKLEQRSISAIDRATDEKLPPNVRGEALAQAAILNPTTIGTMAKHFLDYTGATPEERQTQVAIASGMESPKEKTARADMLTQQAVEWGMSPQQARQYGDATANNKPLSPELQSALPKITPQNLMYTMQAMKTMSDAGVAGDQLANGVAAFQMGGAKAIAQYLPKQTPTEIQQEYNKSILGLQKQELAIKEKSLATEQERTNIMLKESNARIGEIEATTAERKAMASERDAMAKKLGVSPDNEVMKTLQESIHTFAAIKNPDARMKSLMQQTEDSYAQLLGLKPTVKKGWFSDSVSYEQQKGLVGDENVGAPQTGTPGGQPASESNPDVSNPFVDPAMKALGDLTSKGASALNPLNPPGASQSNPVGNVISDIVKKGVVGAFPESQRLTEEQK